MNIVKLLVQRISLCAVISMYSPISVISLNTSNITFRHIGIDQGKAKVIAQSVLEENIK